MGLQLVDVGRGSRRRAIGSSATVLALAVLASAAVYHHLLARLGAVAPGSAHHTNDPMQAMWNLEWVARQLVDGGDPFVTRAINYPTGVSLAWNTLMPTLGIAGAPLTLVAGAAVSYTVLLVLAPALTTLTAYHWLRRWTARPVTAALGGFTVGFSPYQAGHMLGHLNLTFTALLPVILMLLEDLLWRAPRPPRRTAVYLGLVTAAQAGIDEELLLVLAIGTALAVAAALLVAGPAVSAAVRRSLRPLAVAVAVFLVAAAPLLVHQLLLSDPVPLRMSSWGAHLSDLVVPTGQQLWRPPIPGRTALGGAESGVYTGPLLLAVLAAGLALTVRQAAVRVAGLTLLGLVVLSLGTTGPFGLPLPWRAVADVPVFMSMLPVRFSAASWLAVAWLLARWSDGLLDRAAAGGARPAVPALGAAAIGASVVVTLAPNPIGATALPDVAWASSSAARQDVPRGTAALLLPMPYWGDATGMYLQQQAGFGFDQPGAYALRRQGSGPSYGPDDTPLARLSIDAGPYRPGAGDLEAARAQLRGYRAVVVVLGLPDTPRLVQLAQSLTLRPADRCGRGVCVWRLPARPRS